MDFVCKDFESALHSLSQTMGVSEDKIISVLEFDWEKQYEKDYRIFDQNDFDDESFPENFGDYILQRGFSDAELTAVRPAIHWFHGARSIAPDDYLRFGILPLAEMYPKITQMVDNIASKLNIKSKECKSKLQEHHKWLADFKLNDSIAHGGPFAVLVYEAASTPEIFGNHSYIDEPEIISDYAYMMYDKEAEFILEEFKRISAPIIVEFIEPCSSNSSSMNILTATVIQYLYSTIHNEKDKSQCNICFSNKGKFILPELIIKIYRI